MICLNISPSTCILRDYNGLRVSLPHFRYYSNRTYLVWQVGPGMYNSMVRHTASHNTWENTNTEKNNNVKNESAHGWKAHFFHRLRRYVTPKLTRTQVGWSGNKQCRHKWRVMNVRSLAIVSGVHKSRCSSDRRRETRRPNIGSLRQWLPRVFLLVYNIMSPEFCFQLTL